MSTPTKVVLPKCQMGTFPISTELRQRLEQAGLVIVDFSSKDKGDLQLTAGDIACLEAGRPIEDCIRWRRKHPQQKVDLDPYGGVLAEAEVADALTHGKPWREFPGDVA